MPAKLSQLWRWFMVRATLCLFVTALLLGAVLTTGCATDSATPPPPQDGDPSTRALNDPMGYHPTWQNDGDDRTITGGGGIGDFNKKAFDRDLDHVLNP